MPVRTCLFCGSDLSGNRAREHVIPRWLLQELEIESEIIRPAVAKTEDMEIVGHRRHSMGAMQEGNVCALCNNGWMCQLEAHVKPLLLALIDRSLSPERMTDEQRYLVSRWATKTAYMLNSSSNLEEKIRPEHLRSLQSESSRLPDGVFVF